MNKFGVQTLICISLSKSILKRDPKTSENLKIALLIINPYPTGAFT